MASGSEIERLIQLLAKLPGLGPRSARRAALVLLKKRDLLLEPLATAMQEAAAATRNCEICGNLDTTSPCAICRDPRRDPHLLCVVEDVADLWALERASVFRGRYHVLGGALSALDGVTPDRLNVASLLERVKPDVGQGVDEVILAMNATVEGQTTAHYLMDMLGDIKVTRLAHGVPVGGELDYLDEGTLSAAFKARRTL
jgi:recombination protein RecR